MDGRCGIPRLRPTLPRRERFVHHLRGLAMSERIAFIENPVSGRQTLLMDFSGFTTAADALPFIDAAREVVSTQPARSLLGVVDVTGSKFNTRVVEAMKEFAAHNAPFMIASGIVGVAGLQRVILDSVIAITGRSNLKAFPTRGEALSWLATQA